MRILWVKERGTKNEGYSVSVSISIIGKRKKNLV